MTLVHSKGTTVSWNSNLIANLLTIAGLSAERGEIDATDLDSNAKEFELDIPDNGNVEITFNYDSSAGQDALKADNISGTSRTCVITFANAETATFTAYCKSFSLDAGVGKLLTGKATLRITGTITWA